ncbi:helix-turn-helix domain-containing protein [Lysinibacillus xylanilyticus]|uniref:helix-turn-helix domain-containing protein n=1 Tax=Lysinibacillus xylanilyticus TaxID=582475 RepID=UPI003D00E3EA
MSLGKTIRTARNEAGLTMNELAEKTDLTQGYVSKIENDLKVPTKEVLQKISTILKIPFIDLMTKAGYIKTFGQSVREFREEKGWSLDELERETINFEYGEPIFINETTLSKIENGEIKNPSVYEIYLLSYALGVYPWSFSTIGLTTPEKDLETFLSTDQKPEPINFMNNLLNMLMLRFQSSEMMDSDKDEILNQYQTFIEAKKSYIEQLNILSASGKPVATNKEDGDTLVSPLLLQFEKAGGKVTHEICFEVPAYQSRTERGITSTKIISLDQATESFLEVKNLLRLKNVNYNGFKLSQNDIKKIISKIEEMKDEFEYQD